MTRNAERGLFSTGIIEAVVTDGRLGAPLLAQAKERTQKIFISFLRYLHAWWQYETTVRELWNLSDRELADLGITRKDITRVASDSPNPEDRAKYRVL